MYGLGFSRQVSLSKQWSQVLISCCRFFRDYLCFLSCNSTIYPQNHGIIYVFCLVILLFILKIFFHLVLVLNSMSWNIGFSGNLILKLNNKLGRFHIVLEEKP